MLKKFFAKFQNQELYNAFKISKDFATPNISKIVSIKKPVCIKLTNINWASLTDGESIASIDVPEILHKINASYSDNTNAEVNVVSLNAFDDNECKIESNKYWFKRPGIYFIKGIFGYKRTNNFIKWVIKEPIITSIKWEDNISLNMIQSETAPIISNKVIAAYSNGETQQFDFISINVYSDNTCKTLAHNDWYNTPGVYYIKGKYNNFITSNYITYTIKEEDHDYYLYVGHEDPNTLDLNNINAGSFINNEMSPGWVNLTKAGISIDDNTQFDIYVEGTTIGKWYIAIPKPLVSSNSNYNTVASGLEKMTNNVIIINGNEYNVFTRSGESKHTTMWFTSINNVTDPNHIFTEDHDYYLYVGHEVPNTLDLDNINAGSFINNEMTTGWVNLTQAGISIDDNTRFDIYVEGTTIGKWYIAIPKPLVSSNSNYNTVASGLEKMSNNVIIINGNEYNVFTRSGESKHTSMWFTSVDNVTDPNHIFTEDHDYYLYVGHEDPNTLDLNNINAGSFIENEMAPGWVNLTQAGISIDDNTQFDIYVEGNESAKWYIAIPKPLVSTNSNYNTVASGLEKMTNNVVTVKGHEYNVFTRSGESLHTTMWFTSIDNVTDPNHIFT